MAIGYKADVVNVVDTWGIIVVDVCFPMNIILSSQAVYSIVGSMTALHDLPNGRKRTK